MKIHYVKGDATRPIGDGKKIIVHICNNIGAWGAGFVLALSKRWSDPEESYRELSVYDRILGLVQLIPVEKDITVANMIAQDGVGPSDNGVPPIRYDAVRKCLEAVDHTARLTKATIHMPRIGCGLAGGSWETIEKIIYAVVTVDVYVYDLN